MKLPITKGVVFALLFASGAAVATAAPTPLGEGAGILLAYLLPGFVFFTFLGERGRPWLDDLLFSIVISPIILVLLVLVFHASGVALDASVRTSVFFLLALLAAALLREMRDGSETAPIPARSIIVTCAAFGAAVLVAFLANRYLLIRSDGWYHGCIVSEIVDRGIPPNEPLLPDVPIRYMWIYHLFIASTKALTGLGVFPSLAVFNIMNALAFPYLTYRITMHFTTRRRDLIATPILAISGLASAAWIWWPLGLARAFVGENRGWGEALRLLRDIDLDSYRVIVFLSPFETMSGLGNWMINVVDKFITITAFAFTLNIFLLVFIIALSSGSSRRFAPRAVITTFVLMLGALLCHVVMGTVIVLTIIGKAMLLAINGIIKRKLGKPAPHTIAMPAAAILATIAAYPYIHSLTAGSDTNQSLGAFVHFGLTNIITIALPLLALFQPARKALREIYSCATPPLTLLAAWITTLFVLNVFINLAFRNESKIVFPLFLILLPPVAWKVLDWIEGARGARRVAIIAWTALLFAVPPILTYRGFLLDKPSGRVEERRYSVTAADRTVYDWIAANTPLNSVIIGSSICDLSPVFMHRRDFYPDVQTISVFGYDSEKIRTYKGIQDKFLMGVEPTPEDIKVLVDLDCPIYVILWHEDLDRIPRAQGALDGRPDWFEPVFENPAARVYFVRGT